MRRRPLVAAGVLAVSALAVYATLRYAIGAGLLEYNLAFVALAGTGVAAWPLLLRRRVASLGLAGTGLVAVATGFWLLYWKADLKASGLKDFAKFWHSVASVAMIPFFAAHYARNGPRLLALGRKLTRWRAAAGAYAGGWVGLLAFMGLTWLPDWKSRFTEENYLHLAAWTWFLVVAAVYFPWLVAKLAARGSPRARDLLTRNNRRALVDWTLLGAFVLATLTGFLLLYFKTFLHGDGFKYVSKFWHTAPSIAFTVFVALHVGANVLALRAHATRVARELDPPPLAPRP